MNEEWAKLAKKLQRKAALLLYKLFIGRNTMTHISASFYNFFVICFLQLDWNTGMLRAPTVLIMMVMMMAVVIMMVAKS